MKKHEIDNFVKGWFIGPFLPSLFSTDQFECAVKAYKLGDYEAAHFHKIATEYTVIATGTVKMNGTIYESGSIVEIPPGEVTDFEALTDTVTFVVKVPAVPNDKYIA